MAGWLGGEGAGAGGGAGGFCADAMGAKSEMVNASSARMRLRLFIGGILEAERLRYCILGGPPVWVKAFQEVAGVSHREEFVKHSHMVRTTRNWALPLVMRA